jgi:hypothetical protein
VIIKVYSVPLNSPKPRVTKRGGLWQVYLNGCWIASYGSWANAIRCAADGVIW